MINILLVPNLAQNCYVGGFWKQNSKNLFSPISCLNIFSKTIWNKSSHTWGYMIVFREVLQFLLKYLFYRANVSIYNRKMTSENKLDDTVCSKNNKI